MSLVLIRSQQESDGTFKTVSTPDNELCLTAAGYLEIELDPVLNKTGDVWHVCVDGMKNIQSMCYAWRADGFGGKATAPHCFD